MPRLRIDRSTDHARRNGPTERRRAGWNTHDPHEGPLLPGLDADRHTARDNRAGGRRRSRAGRAKGRRVWFSFGTGAQRSARRYLCGVLRIRCLVRGAQADSRFPHGSPWTRMIHEKHITHSEGRQHSHRLVKTKRLLGWSPWGQGHRRGSKLDSGRVQARLITSSGSKDSTMPGVNLLAVEDILSQLPNPSACHSTDQCQASEEWPHPSPIRPRGSDPLRI